MVFSEHYPQTVSRRSNEFAGKIKRFETIAIVQFENSRINVKLKMSSAVSPGTVRLNSQRDT